jgi:hypothetical protein
MTVNEEVWLPDDEDLESFLERHFDGVRSDGAGWMACCPAHDDHTPSLSIDLGDDGRVLLYCHAGCPTEAVLEAAGLEWADLYPDVAEQDGPVLPRQRRPALTDEESDLRDRVYRDLLKELTLSNEHRQHLRGRGLTDEEIDRRDYRTLEGDRYIATKLYGRYSQEELVRVPGFEKEEVSDPHRGGVMDLTLFTRATGLLIPMRDARGRIISAQVRRFGAEGPKYLCLRGSRGLAHVPLGISGPCSVVRITEGPLKADVVTSLRPDIPTVAVPGTGAWREALGLLEQLQPGEVRLAFDADWQTNPGVAKALLDLGDELQERGYLVVLEKWDVTEAKGIDDLIAAGRDPEVVPFGQVRRVVEMGLSDAAGASNGVTTGGEKGEWSPIRPLEETHQVPPFPLQVLPPPLATFVSEVATSVGVPPDLPGMALLAVAGGLIGRSRAVAVREGWTELPCLYVALVAESGTGKTPALNHVLEPARGIDAHLHQHNRKARERQKAAMKGKDKRARPAPEPVPMRRLSIDDFTGEALAGILQSNPRGVILAKDELTAWVTSMNQYRGGRGTDRQVFLSIWSGTPIQVDRKNNMEEGPIVVPGPFVAVVGNLPPSQAAKLSPQRDDQGDGFVERILFVWPERLPIPPVDPEHPRGLAPAVRAAWAGVAEDLFNLRMRNGDNSQEGPVLLPFSEDARKLFWDRHNEHIRDLNEDEIPDHLRPAWSKLTAHAARLALILQLLWEPDSTEVTQEAVARAWDLVTYLKGHLRRAHGAIATGGEMIRAEALVAWLRRRNLREFKPRDVLAGMSRSRFRDMNDLMPVLTRLEDLGYLRRRDPQPRRRPRGGRGEGPTYEVNPALWEQDS